MIALFVCFFNQIFNDSAYVTIRNGIHVRNIAVFELASINLYFVRKKRKLKHLNVYKTYEFHIPHYTHYQLCSSCPVVWASFPFLRIFFWLLLSAYFRRPFLPQIAAIEWWNFSCAHTQAKNATAIWWKIYLRSFVSVCDFVDILFDGCRLCTLLRLLAYTRTSTVPKSIFLFVAAYCRSCVFIFGHCWNGDVLRWRYVLSRFAIFGKSEYISVSIRWATNYTVAITVRKKKFVALIKHSQTRIHAI